MIRFYFLLFFLILVDSVSIHLKRPKPKHKCSNGKYLITKEGKEKCHTCRLCRKGYTVKEPCTETSDTVCELCPSGTYNDVKGGSCRQCSTCQPGQFRSKRCNYKHDTVCKSCPTRTFSSYPDVGACRYCTRCRPNEQQIAPCTKTNDTVCGNCVKGYFREFGSSMCVPCSECPVKYSNLVVKECQDALGLDSANVCWPTYDRDLLFRLDVSDTSPSVSEDLEEAEAENKLSMLTTTEGVKMAIAMLTVIIMMIVLILLSAFVIRTFQITCSSRQNEFLLKVLKIFPFILSTKDSTSAENTQFGGTILSDGNTMKCAVVRVASLSNPLQTITLIGPKSPRLGILNLQLSEKFEKVSNWMKRSNVF